MYKVTVKSLLQERQAAGARWLRCPSCCFHSHCRSLSCSRSRCGCWSHPSIAPLLHCYCCCYRKRESDNIILCAKQLQCTFSHVLINSILNSTFSIRGNIQEIPHNSTQTPCQTTYCSNKDPLSKTVNICKLLTSFFTLQVPRQLWRKPLNSTSDQTKNLQSKTLYSFSKGSRL